MVQIKACNSLTESIISIMEGIILHINVASLLLKNVLGICVEWKAHNSTVSHR